MSVQIEKLKNCIAIELHGEDKENLNTIMDVFGFENEEEAIQRILQLLSQSKHDKIGLFINPDNEEIFLLDFKK